MLKLTRPFGLPAWRTFAIAGALSAIFLAGVIVSRRTHQRAQDVLTFDGTGAYSGQDESVPVPQAAGGPTPTGANGVRLKAPSRSTFASGDPVSTNTSVPGSAGCNASELVLSRTVPRPASRAVTDVLERLLEETHPGLPPETVETIAATVGNILQDNLPALGRDEAAVLAANVAASRAEIDNLPFEKSQEHLEYGLDYLGHQAVKWAASFSAFVEHDYDNYDPMAAASSAKELFRGAIEDLYGQESAEADKLIDTFAAQIDVAKDYLFSPEYKFPLTDEQLAAVREQLAQVRADAQRESKETLAQRSHRRAREQNVYIRDERQWEFQRAERDRILRKAWMDCQVLVHAAFKGAVDKAFWKQCHLPNDYADTARQLARRRDHLWQREREAARARRLQAREGQNRPFRGGQSSEAAIRHQMMIDVQKTVEGALDDHYDEVMR